MINPTSTMLKTLRDKDEVQQKNNLRLVTEMNNVVHLTSKEVKKRNDNLVKYAFFGVLIYGAVKLATQNFRQWVEKLPDLKEFIDQKVPDFVGSFDGVKSEIQQKIKPDTSYDKQTGQIYKIDLGNAIKNKIYEEAIRQGVDPAFALAVAAQESGFRQEARSKVGAIGVFQLMPGTAKDLKVNPYNLDENIRGGIAYLKQNLKRFGGNEELTLAAYNAGPGAVTKYKGIPPYAETRHYVKTIMGSKGKYEQQIEQAKKRKVAQPQPQKKKLTAFDIELNKKVKQSQNVNFYNKPVYGVKAGGRLTLPKSIVDQYNLVRFESAGLKLQSTGIFKNDYPYGEATFVRRLKQFSDEARSELGFQVELTAGFGPGHLDKVHTAYGTAADFQFPTPRPQFEAKLKKIAKRYNMDILFHDAGSGYHGHIFLTDVKQSGKIKTLPTDILTQADAKVITNGNKLALSTPTTQTINTSIQPIIPPTPKTDNNTLAYNIDQMELSLPFLFRQEKNKNFANFA